jgi:hypothetical protein
LKEVEVNQLVGLFVDYFACLIAGLRRGVNEIIYVLGVLRSIDWYLFTEV